MKLKNRVAIVTGGSSGIGHATSLLFAEEGANIAILDIWEKGGQAVVDELTKLGRRAIFVKCDVSSEAQVEAGIQKTVATFGKIDILFNNAGGGISPDDPPQIRGSLPIDQLTEAE